MATAVVTGKVCVDCVTAKSFDAFYAGHRRCKPCHFAAMSAQRAARRERDGFDRAHVMRTYGVTVEQFREMLARQDGVCAVCRREPEAGPHRGLVLDHDHDTGAVRGLLCRPCNSGIGSLNDDPALLKRALAYLEEN